MPDRHIAISGAGNAAHVLIAHLASRRRLAVYAPLGDEAAQLCAGIGRSGGITAQSRDQAMTGAPEVISARPEEIFPGADLVILALPASAHGEMLAAAAPHLDASALIVAMPARGGFDWEAGTLLAPATQLAGLQTLPWACRVPPGRFGEFVQVLGTKVVVDLAVRPPGSARAVAGSLGELLGVTLDPIASFLALTLANTGQIVHPGIMCGLFGAWDGRPYGEDEVPLFYGGVTAEIAALLQAMSDEVQAICRALESALPGIDLTTVLPLEAWLRRSYAADIGDASSLRTCFTTNRAYAGLRAPMMLAEENALAPWFASRYLTEDVPYGLLVTRGVAELCDVPTPTLDEVINWAQGVLSREWLTGGHVGGRDLAQTRAPQRFGISSVAELT